MNDKVCVICGKTFQSYRPNAMTCSYECRKEMIKRNHAEKVKRLEYTFRKVCPTCGNEFMGRTSSQIYCSDECRFKGALKKRTAPKPKRTMDKIREIAKKASDMEMSYGEYVARYLK